MNSKNNIDLNNKSANNIVVNDQDKDSSKLLLQIDS